MQVFINAQRTSPHRGSIVKGEEETVRKATLPRNRGEQCVPARRNEGTKARNLEQRIFKKYSPFLRLLVLQKTLRQIFKYIFRT